MNRLHSLPPVAIGDIHGCLDLLNAAVEKFHDRHLVLLGDYVDRGPDDRGVLDRVRDLVEFGRATALMGNHDDMMIRAVLEGRSAEVWLHNGGDVTMNEYGDDHGALREDAVWMREHLQQHVIIGGTLFAHAMRPDPTGRDVDTHLWGRPDGSSPLYRLPKGVTHSVHGHTVVDEPVTAEASDGSIVWFIDTGAVHTGILTALDTASWTTTELSAH
ncbi:metallophosphoesterase family protein [Deinococcus malanensis]|nr:metallophosphoesterase family protein [Deinococcus malanensis]